MASSFGAVSRLSLMGQPQSIFSTRSGQIRSCCPRKTNCPTEPARHIGDVPEYALVDVVQNAQPFPGHFVFGLRAATLPLFCRTKAQSFSRIQRLPEWESGPLCQGGLWYKKMRMFTLPGFFGE